MTKYFNFFLLCLLLPALSTTAKEWDEQLYRQIEQSIQTPQFKNKTYLITKYGAKTTLEAKGNDVAAHNQKAIQ
jgi:hypothetical protein